MLLAEIAAENDRITAEKGAAASLAAEKLAAIKAEEEMLIAEKSATEKETAEKLKAQVK